MFGGLVFLLVGRVLIWGELIWYLLGFEFEVLEVDLRLIKWLCVRLSKFAVVFGD